jgi:hypothetical protein
VLTQSDVTLPRSFPDNASYGGWYMDFHPSDGFESGEDSCSQIPVRMYPMPLRCLFSSACPNVLFAGRNIGATHAAFATTRQMDTCAGTGQAAGALAAFCVRTGRAPAAQAAEDAISVQRRLARDDAFIMDVDVREDSDLAQSAKISASSEARRLDAARGGALRLEKPSYVCFPARASDRPQAVTLYADCGAGGATLPVSLSSAPMPSRLAPGKFVAEARIELAAGENMPARLEIPPLAEDGFIVAFLPELPGVSICAAKTAPVGFLMGYRWQTEHMYPLMDCDIAGMYAPGNVANGVARVYGRPNIWISGEGDDEPHIRLDWDGDREVAQVRLYLNPDLSREFPSTHAAAWNAQHFMSGAIASQPETLARDFRAEALVGGEWKEIGRVSGNWRRLVVMDAPAAVRAAALRVVFGASSAPAQLFEVRVYPSAG